MRAWSTFLPLMLAVVPVTAAATTIAPPMLDITGQCNAMAHKNMRLMSECIVAESEARAELLTHWDKLPDAAVESCMKANRKAKRQPYVALQTCLAPELARASTPPVAGAKP